MMPQVLEEGWERRKSKQFYSKITSLRLPDFVWEALGEIAKRENLRISDVLRIAIAEYLRKNLNKDNTPLS
jgi:predicted DNA-binding ribbon-helix-helix protein